VKLLVLIGVICVGAAFAACGGASTSSDKAAKTTSVEKTPATKTAGVKKQPKLTVPPGPPPKNLVVKQLKKGFGAAAHWGERIGVQYVGVSYKTGEPFEVRWQQPQPFFFNFGSGEVRKGWEIGLKGMKVGGRRELILPSRLAYGTGALLYVVELLAIE